jgi:hypothetical protein
MSNSQYWTSIPYQVILLATNLTLTEVHGRGRTYECGKAEALVSIAREAVIDELMWSSRTKDKKVGEGTYAVVYRGEVFKLNPDPLTQPEWHGTGREAATGRKIAIKKIKVGLFKDGLDMSAIREVKYLRELRHPNVIEVWLASVYPTPYSLPTNQLLDVFSHKKNLNLVLEFLDSDLEVIIKDRSLVFLPADIKSWMAMTFRGMEFCHRNHILHRVGCSFKRRKYPVHPTMNRIWSPTTCSSLRTVSLRWPTLASRATSATQGIRWLAKW